MTEIKAIHIAIEGLDGVGKTTVAKTLAKKLNFKFIEKPVHYLLGNEGELETYSKIARKINNENNSESKLLFYGLGNVLTKLYFKNTNIVTDRYLVSNYLLNYKEDTKDIFEAIINHSNIPDITFVLHADEESRKKRLINRNPYDEDIKHINKYEKPYERMVEFLNNREMPYFVIDTTNKAVENICNEIIQISKEKIIHDKW